MVAGPEISPMVAGAASKPGPGRRYRRRTVTSSIGAAGLQRGADLLDSTPRQILLQRALGLPTEDADRLRLDAARHLLETTDLTVAGVAREVGFRSPERLHRAVKRHLGTTPDRYRQHFARTSA